jgi:Rps23 Pro-64 3,4-dihydroxylase Tpa1-like proline 4-hydroxylase
MSCAQTVDQTPPLFDYWKWNSQLPALTQEYASNRPLPHLVLKNFLDPDLALLAADEFPSSHTQVWTQYKHHNENKLGMSRRELFPEGLGRLADELNSPRFVSWLSRLTGISNLVADPRMEGGGLHESRRGGFLNLHTDFSHHHYQHKWRRRVNLILYLNRDWRKEWGGDIEFWDSSMERCVAKYPPQLNHVMIFNTDARCFHGFPEPLRCPEDVARRSLALYYYTIEPERKTPSRSTDYRARPQDGLAESMAVWFDKQMVDLYSRAKTRFKFSDEFASKLLGLISRKK